MPFVGEAVWLEAHVQNDLLSRPQQDANGFERLGLVDPAGLLTRFGPLAIFLLAFSVAGRERERGVLALALGNTPARRTYFAAKIASIATVSIVILVLPIALIGALSTATGSGHTIDEAMRLAGWTLVAVAYVSVVSIIAVFICLTARSVQTAFAGLLVTWVVLVLAALPAASAVADWRSPLPSFQQMKLVLADEAPAYSTPETGADHIGSILRRYGASRESDLAAQRINVRGAQLDLAERRAQEVFDREIGGFYDRVAAQDATYARLAWLSPAVAFDVASAAFAGTDFSHHRQVHRLRRVVPSRVGEPHECGSDPHPAVDGREHTNDLALWSQVPAFEYEPPPAAHAVRSALSALLALGCWLLSACGLGAVGAKYVAP